jgi:ABC-type transport system involved in multi-copper enzyme maturation permease subunit
MIWVTWRQHRAQAISMLVLLAVIAVYAVATGAWMRSAFSADGLGGCLARSGGAGCGATITAFFKKFGGTPTMPAAILAFLIPGFLGAAVGAPVLGAELERGTWQLAWSQAVPRSRWLAVKLGLIMGALAVFGVAVTLLLTWSRSPLDRVSIRLQPPPFNFEGIQLPCELLCGFSLALLAGLLLRNTIGAMVAAYFAWEVPFVAGTLLTGPIHVLTTTTSIGCDGSACTAASTNSSPPVTGNLGDLVLGITRGGGHLIVSYLPASEFWPLQFIIGGMYLAITAAAVGATVWLLHRRTT